MKHWMMIAGVFCAVLTVVIVVLFKPADTTASTQTPSTQTPAPIRTHIAAPVTQAKPVDTNDQPRTVAIPQDPEEIHRLTQKVNQEQKQAQQIVADQVVILPIKGTIRTRPDFVSDMEWTMLQSAAQANANPDSELNHLVNLLRFNKMIEQYQNTRSSLTPENQQKLAAQLLAELPNYTNSGDIDQRDARELSAQLSRDTQTKIR